MKMALVRVEGQQTKSRGLCSPLVSCLSSLSFQSSAQALVETALIVPLLLMAVLNVINFGYFFLVAVNLAAAPRSGGLYSILGESTPASRQATFGGLPPAGDCSTTSSVSYLTTRDVQDLANAGCSSGGDASLQVCSTTACSAGAACVSGSGTSMESQCQTFGSTPAYTFPSVTYDPENNGSTPLFYLNRVDIAYQFTPLIRGAAFNVALLAAPICTTSGGVSCVFHQRAVMREMN